MSRQPHPVVRFGAGLPAITAVFVCVDLRLLCAAALVVAALTLISGVLRQFLRFLMLVMVPFALVLTVVWVGVMGAPPGTAIGTDRSAAVHYTLLIVLRLAVCSGLFQVLVLSIPPEELLATLRRARLPDDLAIMVLSTLAIIPELKLRADQVLTARLARGLFGKPTLRSRVLQFPQMLVPLASWTLRSALQRAESWAHRDLVGRLCSLPSTAHYSLISSLFAVLLTAVFCVLAIRTRFELGR